MINIYCINFYLANKLTRSDRLDIIFETLLYVAQTVNIFSLSENKVVRVGR